MFEKDRNEDLVIVLKPIKNNSSDERYHAAFMEKLQELELYIQEVLSTTTEPPVTFLKIYATWNFLVKTAERLQVPVSVTPNDVTDMGFCRSHLKDLRVCPCMKVHKLKDIPFELHDHLKIQFTKDLIPYFDNMESKEDINLFTPCQRTKMVDYDIQRISIPMLNTDEFEENNSETTVNFKWLQHKGIYGNIYVTHESNIINEKHIGLRKWLGDHWAKLKHMLQKQPLDYVNYYWGPEIAFYFAWQEFYTRMLFIPACLSIPSLIHGIFKFFEGPITKVVCSEDAKNITICRTCPQLSCDYRILSDFCMDARLGELFDNPSTLAYAVCASLWAVALQELSKLYQKDLASKWRCMGKASKGMHTSAEFLAKVKTTRINPVTKKKEKYVYPREKFLRKTLSVVVAAILLIVLLVSTLGIIFYKTVAAGVYMKLNNKFINKVTPKLLASITASIMNLILISLMGYIYPKIAWRLTQLELPITKADFETSYIYKVVFFQFFNNYATLFYLSFIHGRNVQPPQYQSVWDAQCGPAGCMAAVSIQLIIISTGKQVSQLLSYVLTRLFKKWYRILLVRMHTKSEKVADQCEKDYFLLAFSQPILFDEYLTTVIQYGFIVMFAPAFPLASLCAFFYNLVQIRIQAYGYINGHKRPVPQETQSIGPWQDIMDFFTRVSVVTSAALIAFTSTDPSTQLYSYVYSKRHPNSTLFHFAYSLFNTSDYYNGIPDESKVLGNLTVSSAADLSFSAALNKSIDYCYYLGSFNPPGNPYYQAYTRTTEYYIILVCRLIYFIVFQNACILFKELIVHYFPNEPKTVRNRTLREDLLEEELQTKIERGKRRKLIKQGKQNRKMENSKTSDNPGNSNHIGKMKDRQYVDRETTMTIESTVYDGFKDKPALLNNSHEISASQEANISHTELNDCQLVATSAEKDDQFNASFAVSESVYNEEQNQRYVPVQFVKKIKTVCGCH